jgi:hypothetical protein
MTMAARLADAPTTSQAADLARLVPTGGLVVAVTDDGSDPRYEAVRDAAAELAAAAHGKVLLFHAPPGQSESGPIRPRLYFPVLDGTDGSTTRQHTGSRQRDLLAHEATAIRARGVGVAVWLSGRAGPSGLAEAVSLTHAAVVLVAAERARPGVIRRTLDYHASKVAAPVVAVDPGGGLAEVRPLGGTRPALGLPSAPALDAIWTSGPEAATAR